MTKKLGYYLFSVFFTLFRIFPVQKEKIFLIATHDDSDEGNVGIVEKRIREEMPEKRMVYLTKGDGIRHPFSFFVLKAYHLATAKTIFMDNVFMPMAYTSISKKVKVVQLWHGTGTIKKFGLDSDSDDVAKLAKKVNAHITHLIVNSEYTKEQYRRCFGVASDKVFVTGLPRTDLILNQEEMIRKEKKFYEKYPELIEKRCVLYAPTFRDHEVEQPKLALNLSELASTIKEDEVLLLRLHPHVAANFSSTELAAYKNTVVNVSDYPGTSTLLTVSDMLITDYSSIVFEYCLLGRPILFYAYDLEEFEENGRDFYEPYRKYVPGPVVTSQKELMQYWDGKYPYKENIESFKKKAYSYLDENAVKRLFELIF